MQINKNRSTKTKKIIIVSGISALLIGGLVSAYFIAKTPHGANSTQINKQSANSTAQASVSTTPQSDVPQSQPEKGTNTAKPKIDVVPLISNYGLRDDATFTVSGLITGIVEQGGKCTITLSWDGGSKAVTVTTTTGPNSTNCVEAQFATNLLPETSKITAELSYASDVYSGTSKNNPTFVLENLRDK